MNDQVFRKSCEELFKSFFSSISSDEKEIEQIRNQVIRKMNSCFTQKFMKGKKN